MTLFEADANNQPNYETGQTIVFSRSGESAAQPSVQNPQKPPKPAVPPAMAGGEVNLATALPIAFGLPRVVAMNAYLSRSLVVEAVYQATALSGVGMMGQVTNTYQASGVKWAQLDNTGWGVRR